MQLILLSGGSGTRLWPLSNDARSKQFLKLLPVEGSDQKESMIQRIVRQIKDAGLNAELTIATSYNQKDSVISQLGNNIDIVVEPSRRNTFPAICLSCEYLKSTKSISDNETIIILPCDPYTDRNYFDTIKRMVQGVNNNVADLIVMGIQPTYPSAKYGYVLPGIKTDHDGFKRISRFIEKPNVEKAKQLIKQGAKWNGGVFAFKLGFLLEKARQYVSTSNFPSILNQYSKYPETSFDYEVAENTESVAMVSFNGKWKDLGSWNTLTDEIPVTKFGNVITDDTISGTHIFNNLDIPLLCLGTENLVIAASPDGIIVTEKGKSENVKHYAKHLKKRPMYEERRWGVYKVIDHRVFDDGFECLTKFLSLNPGCAISYQRHAYRDEIWTFIDGEGELVIDGSRKIIKRGESVTILKNQMHALRAFSPLSFIEIQQGKNLVEEDIERFDFHW